MIIYGKLEHIKRRLGILNRTEHVKVSIRDAKVVIKFVWNHPANEGRRVRVLLRAVAYQARGRLLNKRTLTPIGNHSYIWAYLHRTAASKAVYANPPDYPEMLVWQQTLMPGDLFIDVGANVGSYSILAADLGAHVIALEPAPDTFALLAENVQLNGYSVTMIQAAAGVNCGTSRFTTGQDCVNQLAANGPVEIEMVSLDSVIKDRVVAGIKVDVEGFEIDVLRGCERALSQQRLKLIQLEWNSSSVEAVGSDRAPIAELLANYGYGLYRPGMDGTLVLTTDLGFGPDVFALPNLLKSGYRNGGPQRSGPGHGCADLSSKIEQGRLVPGGGHHAYWSIRAYSVIDSLRSIIFDTLIIRINLDDLKNPRLHSRLQIAD